MNRTVDFLRLIWPDNGFYALAAINRQKHVFQHFITAVDETAINSFVSEHIQRNDDIYMAVGSFADQRRMKSTSNGLRALFLDIDIGQKTPYATVQDALKALNAFCTTVNLPIPSALVKSGGGLHAYWATNEVMPAALWEQFSKRLIALLPDSPLFIKDPGISADAARILRLPGTYNHKELTLRPVELIHLGQRYPLGQLVQALGMPGTAPGLTITIPHVPVHLVDGTLGLTATLASIGTKPKSFRALVTRCTQGTGCEQITQSIRSRTEETEPLWRAVLSIAKFCEDGAEAIHVVSKDHPHYTPEETEAKAALIVGPYKCDSFDTQRPGLCQQCPHYGRITSPIQLGELLAPANSTQQNLPSVAPLPVAGTSPLSHILANEPIMARAVETPWPYVLAGDGCTYRLLNDISAKEAVKQGRKLVAIGTDSAVKEYPGHLSLLGRAYDAEHGQELLHVAYKMGVEASRTSMVPTKDVGSLDLLRKAMAGGAIMTTGDANFVQTFLSSAVRHDTNERKADQLLHKYGWYNNNLDFVYGNYAMRRDGSLANAIMQNSEGSSSDTPLQVKGSPLHWIKMAEYWNREEHNDMAFTLLSTFGAPLMSLMNVGVAGALIHLFTPDSGFGKSALQTMITAAYGNSTALMFSPQDTVNALLNRVGRLSNLPICIDEVTNLPGERLSDLVYQVTQGREKLRMKQDYTGNMKPSGDWCTTVVTSGNASITDKMFALKASPEGELMRFLELRPTAKLGGAVTLASLMDGVTNHYGGVGAMYLYHIVNHRAEVLDVLSQVKTRLQADKGLGEAQRFWLALMTCNLAGGLIAQRLGFIRYDMSALEQWALNIAHKRATDIGQRKVRPNNVFSDLLSKLSANMVVAPSFGTVVSPKLHPLARIDYRTNLLSISMSAITQEAHKYQVAVSDMLKGLVGSQYAYVGNKDIEITAGLAASMFPPVTIHCAQYSFDPAVVHEDSVIDLPNNVVTMRK